MKAKWPMVLMGWYLLAPPAGFRHALNTDRATPVHQWVQLGSFDTAVECQEHLEMVRHGRDPLLKQVAEADLSAPSFVGDHARCIASDDPRLRD